MSLPDYYKILEVDSGATQDQIRTAYKKAALKTHPDRVGPDSPDRASRTKRFQEVNDAYFTLSDKSRRSDYDATRRFHSSTSSEAGSDAGPDFASGSFPWSAFGFGGSSSGARKPGEEEKMSSEQFGDAFEEMLREEGMAEDRNKPTSKFWSVVGGLSGGAMGFIVANFPGAIAGAVAGNRLGAIRDAKGKSVYQVFQELPQADKARMLSQLAAKILSGAVGVS